MANQCSIDPTSGDSVPNDQAFWNAAAMFAGFVLAVVAFTAVFDRYAYRVIADFTFLDLTILGLATFRLIRLFTYDKIFAFVRLYFMDACEKDGVPTYQKPPGGFRRMVIELIECIWCVGMWAALGLFTLYLATPFGWFVAVILAISALGSFFQNLSQMITRIGK